MLDKYQARTRVQADMAIAKLEGMFGDPIAKRLKNGARRNKRTCFNVLKNQQKEWCPGADLNHRHGDFQSPALPLSYPGIPSPSAG